MTGGGSQSGFKNAEDIRTRLREVDVVLSHCNCSGDLMGGSAGEADWLTSLFACSDIIRDALGAATRRWSDQNIPVGEMLIPGVWCEPVELKKRRKRTGYGLLFIPTDQLATSPQLPSMCQCAGITLDVCRRQLDEANLGGEAGLGRAATMARYMVIDAQEKASDTKTMDSIGQQLAESYEEISLLYTISQNMTVVQRPQHFIRAACRGLLGTLPYRCIGARFLPEVSSLPLLADKLIVEGEPGVAHDRLQLLTERLVGFAVPDTPTVLDPRLRPEHAEFDRLGDPILLHPLARDGKILGILFAAGKEGRDRAASSMDMKLLGATATHTGIFLENAALYEDLEAMFVGTLGAITATIDAKDPYTSGHSQRVARLAMDLATAIGLDDEVARRVHVAGLVHDVGKIGVPESVLSKPGRLTDEEFDLIKQHPSIGFRILKDIPQLSDVLPGVLHHHERWDGHGYPHGLRGGEIPMFARLIALSDSFDAMSSTRTYRAARDRKWVLDEIRNCAGKQFDPELAPAFLSLDFSGFDRMIETHRNAAARDRVQDEAA